MTRDRRPERIRPMTRRHFVQAKAYIHRPVATQDPQVANGYARDLIREVERLTALVPNPAPRSMRGPSYDLQIVDEAALLGEAVVGEVPVCNGKCHTGDYPDFDRDCPAHGGEREICPEGCGLVQVADQSVETSGYEERQRDYYVTWLVCGHEISVEKTNRRRPMVDVDTGGRL